MSEELDQFFASHDWDLYKKLNQWNVKRDGFLTEVELLARDGEKFKALIECNGYPNKAPSVVFINNERSCQDPKAWPRGNKSFLDVVKPPSNCFLCMPLTREGLNHHPNWINTPAGWNPTKNTLMDIINYLQRLLCSKDYEGRGE